MFGSFRSFGSRFGARAGARGRRSFHNSSPRFQQSNPPKIELNIVGRAIEWVKEHPFMTAVGSGAALYALLFGKKSMPEAQREPIPAGASNSVPPPGGDMPISTKILETGSSITQNFDQLKGIHTVLDSIHFYNGDPRRQVESYHLCSHLNEDFKQCLIYDGPDEAARLIGVEYIISERLFNQLPESERKLWHSHHYEVKSGILVAPNVPDIAERQLMKETVNTYGKTWHFWQVDRGDVLPVGGPRLMMSFTNDGQVREDLLKHRDESIGISSAEKRKSRKAIPQPPIVRGADAWQDGEVVQSTLEYI